MILVDTSAWFYFFRARGPVADDVDDALESGEAALCGPVLTEIRRGLRAPQRRRVLPLLDGCHLLRQPDELWLSAGDLGAVLSRRGVTVKTLDLLIAVYAIAHGTPVLTTDGDFRTIAALGVGLSLAN